MAQLSMNEFMSDTKPSGNSIDHFNLKETGKGIVFLHPKSGIYKRNTHWFPTYKEVTIKEEGKAERKEMQVRNEMIVCPGVDIDPICALRKALRNNEDISNDEIILLVGKGKETVEYTKADIIGLPADEGGDWKKNLAYKTEYLFGVIDKDKAEIVQPLVAPKSLGKKITKVIEDQIEEEGEKEGNPFINPYAFKLTFDKDEQPSNMYDASWNKSPATDEIKELLNGDGVDLSPLVELTPINKICWIIKQALVYDADELGLNLSSADNYDPNASSSSSNGGGDASKGKPKDGNKGAAKNAAKKQDKVEEPDDDEQEAPAKKSTKTAKTTKTAKATKTIKAAPKKKPQIDCPNCNELIDEDAMVCEHCEAEFEEVEMIECPECGQDVPSDSESCPECGEDISPF